MAAAASGPSAQGNLDATTYQARVAAGERRVAVLTADGRKISGFTSPKEKNLEEWLRKHPGASVYVSLKNHIEKAKRQAQTVAAVSTHSLSSLQTLATVAAAAAVNDPPRAPSPLPPSMRIQVNVRLGPEQVPAAPVFAAPNLPPLPPLPLPPPVQIHANNAPVAPQYASVSQTVPPLPPPPPVQIQVNHAPVVPVAVQNPHLLATQIAALFQAQFQPQPVYVPPPFPPYQGAAAAAYQAPVAPPQAPPMSFAQFAQAKLDFAEGKKASQLAANAFLDSQIRYVAAFKYHANQLRGTLDRLEQMQQELKLLESQRPK